MEKETCGSSSQTFQKKIGRTTYVVNVHFSKEENAPAMEDKLLRLMERGNNLPPAEGTSLWKAGA